MAPPHKEIPASKDLLRSKVKMTCNKMTNGEKDRLKEKIRRIRNMPRRTLLIRR